MQYQPLPEERNLAERNPAERNDLDWDDEEREPKDHGNDSAWDVFIPDDDERDPQPEPGDFWIEFDRVEFACLAKWQAFAA